MTRRLIVADNPDAVEWARAYFATLRTTRDPLTGVHWLSKEGNRRAFVDALKALARQTPLQMIATVVEAENGWDLADQALREIAAEMIERGETQPTSLAAYVQKALLRKPPAVKHTQKADRWLRNLAITHAVETLASRFGVPETGRKGSACAIVAHTMGRGAITARGVETVWREYSPWLARLETFRSHLQTFTVKELAA